MIKEIAIIKRILRKKITYYDHNNLLLLSYFKIYFYMSNFASIGRFDLVYFIIASDRGALIFALRKLVSNELFKFI